MKVFDYDTGVATDEEIALAATITWLGMPYDDFLKRNPRFLTHRLIPTRKNDKGEWLWGSNIYYRPPKAASLEDLQIEEIIQVADEAVESLEEPPEIFLEDEEVAPVIAHYSDINGEEDELVSQGFIITEEGNDLEDQEV